MKRARTPGDESPGRREPAGRRGVTDHTAQVWIATVLRAGVIAAACIGLAGGVAHLVRHAADVPAYASFHGEPAALRHVADVIAAAVSLNTSALIQAGLLLLIAVPIFRVAVSIVVFALEKDWLYCVVTALVMGILLFSLLGGKL
ncbi:MAG TPA: DUF1634 domain-containing protein [bacterium]|nr:DUF1634 domain-containing protein [bacterium]